MIIVAVTANLRVVAQSVLKTLLVLVCTRSALAEDGPRRKPKRIPPSPEMIAAAIDRGVAWMKSAQRKDGSWGPCKVEGYYGGGEAKGADAVAYPVGPTAFAAFALLKCGLTRKDGSIIRSLNWLRKHARGNERTKRLFGARFRISTYESAAVILMLTTLHAPRRGTKRVEFSDSLSRPPKGQHVSKQDWKWLNEHVQYLVGGPRGGGGCQNKGGGWRYERNQGDQDLSATHFCLLALRSASRAGYPVHVARPTVWSEALEGVRRFQLPSGAFAYRDKAPWSAGMCAAGTASLLICKEQLKWIGQPVPKWVEPAIQKGLTFLGKEWSAQRNTQDVPTDPEEGEIGYHYYQLYGLERVGSLAGKHKLGKREWYIGGADFLLREQRANGMWEDESCMDPKDVLGTSFALLFLKRATMPVITPRERDRTKAK